MQVASYHPFFVDTQEMANSVGRDVCDREGPSGMEWLSFVSSQPPAGPVCSGTPQIGFPYSRVG